ncbi:MAG: NYN domain-containing protein [Limisphaerales bacterium]
MDRVAAFVDAGYLFAAGSLLLDGAKLPRSRIDLNAGSVVSAIEELSKSVSRVSMLRIYWYDGTSSGPTSQHLMMAHQPGVKVRLGFINSVGEQKGVDSLIVTDLITLARNRSMSDAVLLSGDEDLRVGVQQAQEYGVRVHLLGIAPSRSNQSLTLLQESDSTHEWGHQELQRFMSIRPAPASVQIPPIGKMSDGPSQTDTLPTETSISSRSERLRSLAVEHAVKTAEHEREATVTRFRSTGQLPPNVDRPLLGAAKVALEDMLSPDERTLLRRAFVEELQKLSGGGV